MIMRPKWLWSLQLIFCNHEKTIFFLGYKIPKGWSILVFLRYVHTDPENFNDPMHFDPDRWNVCIHGDSFLI